MSNGRKSEFLQPKDRYLGNPLLKRTGVKQEYTKYEIDEFIKCKKNIIYFIDNYIKVIHVDRGLIPLNLYDFQKKLCKMVKNNRFNITMCCRQSGKTTVMMAYLLWYIIFHSDKVVGILANKGSTAREILGKLQLAYENLPNFLQHGVIEFNKGTFYLENGSRVIAASTSSDSIRGYSFSLIYIDEVAFIPPNIWEQFWDSVYPTVSSGKETKVILVSTPNGMNHFYKLWRDSESSKNSFVNYKVIWKQVPGRGKIWKKETIRNTSPEQFRQEQECVHKDTKITIRDKYTNEIFNITIGELYEWLPEGGPEEVGDYEL